MISTKSFTAGFKFNSSPHFIHCSKLKSNPNLVKLALTHFVSPSPSTLSLVLHFAKSVGCFAAYSAPIAKKAGYI